MKVLKRMACCVYGWDWNEEREIDRHLEKWSDFYDGEIGSGWRFYDENGH
eukprot:COSAG05_NODE_1553_length_4572_cov_80.241672_3_plen_49_part_01